MRGHGTAASARAAQQGAALLAALVVMLAVAGSAVSFVWFLDQQQSRAGIRLRAAAAMAAAEAGVQRALSLLEGEAADGPEVPGPRTLAGALTGALAVRPLEGAFAAAFEPQLDGAVRVVSRGEVGGVARRLQVRVYRSSPALLIALYGTGVIRLVQPPAVTHIVPYGDGQRDRPWAHVAAGGGVWFATADVAVNDRASVPHLWPGPVDALAALPARAGRDPVPVRVLLAGDAGLMLGPTQQRVDVQQLQVMGVRIEGTVIRLRALPPMPEVDRAYYRRLAAANTANAGLNGAAGRHGGDSALIRKRDSLYAPAEFGTVQGFLQTGRASSPLRGVVYVEGGLSLVDGDRLRVTDGALVTDGTVRLIGDASLEIAHSAASRTLPGLVILDRGALVVTGGARLRVHGLLYASRTVDISDRAEVEVVGAVLADDPGLAFRNYGASVVVRYDPAVLGTPGLRLPPGAPVVAWIAEWTELR